jgi:threonine dehydratase
VEAEGAPSMLESVRAGKRLKLPQIQTIADGIAVQQPGKINFKLVRQYVKEIVTVSDAQIYEGMWHMLRDVRVVVEPAAAAAPAAVLFNESLRNLGKKVCCVITGSNVSQTLLQQVAQGASLSANTT